MLAFAVDIGPQTIKAPREPPAGAARFDPADMAQDAESFLRRIELDGCGDANAFGACFDGRGAFHGAAGSVSVRASARRRYQVALEVPSLSHGLVFSDET
jgi:hypothetical protein